MGTLLGLIAAGAISIKYTFLPLLGGLGIAWLALLLIPPAGRREGLRIRAARSYFPSSSVARGICATSLGPGILSISWPLHFSMAENGLLPTRLSTSAWPTLRGFISH